MRVVVIIPAAGLGRRFGAAAPAQHDPLAEPRSKIELTLGDKPVFLHAVELFQHRAEVQQIILAVHPDSAEAFAQRWGDRLGFLGVTIVPGGTRERWETVLRALGGVPDGCTHIAVHDAARPLTSAAVIDRVLAAATAYDAVIPAMAVPNTLKRVAPAPGSPGSDPAADEPPPPKDDPLADLLGPVAPAVPPVRPVLETVPRFDLVEVQTPQVFERSVIEHAYARITSGEIDPAGVTDDASLVEAMGVTVQVVEGDPLNFKITRPADAELARAVLAQREAEARSAGAAHLRLFGDDDDED